MSLAKHIFRVGAWTGVSRVLGFVRDMLIARVLGAGRLSDVFLSAFKLPNLFRDLLGEGALSSVFVPIFSDAKKDEKFASNAFSWLMMILLGITIIAEIIMPLIVLILAPGFDPEKFNLTILISRLMFGYLIFICGAAFLSAILNAFSRFALVAAMPATLNVCMIAGLLVAAEHRGVALYIMTAAVVASGVIQFVILWNRVRARKFGLRLIRPHWNTQMKAMFRRMGAAVLGGGFYQINVILGALVASYQSGAVSWLYYSDRMVQLPFAMIGLAAGTIMLTKFSDAIAAKKMSLVYAQQNAALRHTLFLTLPATAGLFVLAEPIIRILFQHGAWTAQATAMVASAIMIQCLALPAMTTSQIYSKTLYAAQDVKTPVKTSVIALAFSSIVYLAGMPFVGFLAVPAGTVAGGVLKNYLLLRTCRKRGLLQIEQRTRNFILICIAGAVVFGAALWPLKDLI